MKLYSYSSEMLTFAHARWARAKLVLCGILAGTFMFFGSIGLNHSVGSVHWSHSADTLAAQNDVMREQLNLISPRVSRLELQTTRLTERADKLLVVLHGRQVVGDTVLRFTYAKHPKVQTPIPVTASYRR